MTRVLIAAGSPVLPLTHLAARALLPHRTRVLETARLAAVQLQGEVPFRTCHITHTHTHTQIKHRRPR